MGATIVLFYVGSESLEPAEFLRDPRRCIGSKQLDFVLDVASFTTHSEKKGMLLPSDVTEVLAQQDVAQRVSPGLKLGAKKIQYVGDIVEAIGGICHPWQKASLSMREFMISTDDSISHISFMETYDMMGQLVREMKNFTACVRRACPEQSEYHTLHFLLEIASRPTSCEDLL